MRYAASQMPRVWAAVRRGARNANTVGWLTPKLDAMLTYHVVSGRMMAAEVKADIVTSNGVIHVIDTVIMPQVNSGYRVLLVGTL